MTQAKIGHFWPILVQKMTLKRLNLSLNTQNFEPSKWSLKVHFEAKFCQIRPNLTWPRVRLLTWPWPGLGLVQARSGPRPAITLALAKPNSFWAFTSALAKPMKPQGLRGAGPAFRLAQKAPTKAQVDELQRVNLILRFYGGPSRGRLHGSGLVPGTVPGFILGSRPLSPKKEDL